MILKKLLPYTRLTELANRSTIIAVFWILRTGAPWRDLPPDYGDWKNTNRRFCRWRDRGVWAKLFELLAAEHEYKWLMIDSTFVKVHLHAAGAAGGNQAMGRNKRGLNTKIHMAVDAAGKPVRFIVTSGTVADCSQAKDLIKDTGAKYLLANRGYDTNAIIEAAQNAGMEVIIPPKKSRKILREYDKNIYKLRHIIENTFLKLKQWRGIATRYVKNLQSMIAAIQIRCIALCINYL
ncbi:MAG: IS5 family transposase [Synergistaceae bacterium]|nr:IS5 family transposase [Synergistaceae bacterium]